MKYKKLRVPLNFILVNISFLSVRCFLPPWEVITSSVTHCVLWRLPWVPSQVNHLISMWTDLVQVCSSLTMCFFILHRPRDFLVSGSASFERYLVICKLFGAFKFGSSHAQAAVVFTWFMGDGLSTFLWLEQVHPWRSGLLLWTWLVHSQRGVQHNQLFTLPDGNLLHHSSDIIIFCSSQLLGALRAVSKADRSISLYLDQTAHQLLSD